MNKVKIKRKNNSALIILLSFVLLILVGTVLLLLPFATKEGETPLSFIEALFTSTTATTTTGLTIRETGSSLSIFGKIVTALLMELGGLSVLVILAFIIQISGQRVGMAERSLFKDSLNQNTVQGTMHMARNTCIYALIVQGFGIIVSMISLRTAYRETYDFFEALGLSVYHNISAFMNAGLDIFGTGNSIAGFHNNPLFTINTAFISLLGGVSGIVIVDLLTARSWKKISLNSKIVLVMGTILTIGGTLLIYVSDIKNLNIFEALYFCTTARSSGFSINNPSEVSEASASIIAALMFIGDAPASTTAGIKTTTVLVMFVAVAGLITGREPHVFKRRVSKQSIYKAYGLTIVSIVFCLVSAYLIMSVDKDFSFFDSLFDVIAAFSTDGLCRGDLSKLSWFSQFILVLDMLLGRVGLLTLLNIFNTKGIVLSKQSFEYIEENVIIG